MKVDGANVYDSDEDDFQPTRRSIEFVGAESSAARRRSLCVDNGIPEVETDPKKKNKGKTSGHGLKEKMKAAFAKKK
eukprot:CAMPEP_0182447620 /NCGR_PEP_ID=MMETSP1172-20130603/18105_1 /TAXON_ID=708627 /ORGANISM="Timspurckia oligopyrenoides, Strain CCMP3278" /LENGTH=76 /DNA_ID=CAMNT_0024644127 /DNA_START=97 /DNA_END=327 /DNA_ORIENTATION=+